MKHNTTRCLQYGAGTKLHELAGIKNFSQFCGGLASLEIKDLLWFIVHVSLSL